MKGGLLNPVWRVALPTGTYQEGLDLVLGRYCAFSLRDHIAIHHFARPWQNLERTSQ